MTDGKDIYDIQLEEKYKKMRRSLVGPECPRCKNIIRYKEDRCKVCAWPWPDTRFRKKSS